MKLPLGADASSGCARVMSSLRVEPGMDLPTLSSEHRLHRLLLARLPMPYGSAAGDACAVHAHWPAELFGLQKVEIYRRASPDIQQAVLEGVGRRLLEEAYFIEKAGISFAGKMLLLGESVEERMLYGCFAAEEARHFQGVRSFLHGALPERPENSFLTLLSDVIASEDRATLQFTIQVVLEGWGLEHYRLLRDRCLDTSLRQLLDGILRDEAGHHGSGRLLFGVGGVGAESLLRIEEAMTAMLQLVRLGPQTLLSALDQAMGGIDRSEKLRVLGELSGPSVAGQKLEQLRQLMRLDAVRPVVERLDARGLFSPLSPEECV